MAWELGFRVVDNGSVSRGFVTVLKRDPSKLYNGETKFLFGNSHNPGFPSSRTVTADGLYKEE